MWYSSCCRDQFGVLVWAERGKNQMENELAFSGMRPEKKEESETKAIMPELISTD